jgi:hypothetical protein
MIALLDILPSPASRPTISAMPKAVNVVESVIPRPALINANALRKLSSVTISVNVPRTTSRMPTNHQG